jgi:hypothetical protein
MICHPKKCEKIHIYEKSNTIAIPKIKNNGFNGSDINQYSLKQGKFDPFKSSPPNSFMSNLKTRMAVYNSSVIKDDSRNSE